jgi:hypothetical protein
MKARSIIYILFSFLTIISGACKKEGSVGPAGPEGPAGSNGTGESASGSGNVVAYTTAKGTTFNWEYTGGRKFILIPVSPQGNAYREGIQMEFKDTLDSNPEDGIVLSYLRIVRAPNDSVWVALPYLFPSLTGTYMDVYKDNINIYVNQDNYVNIVIMVDANITQASSTSTTLPQYKVVSARLIFIPAGEVNNIGERKATVDYRSMSMEQVMQQFNIKEEDFIPY